MSVLDKFLKYVSFETTALEGSDTAASNPLIYHLAQEMLLELQALNPNEISINRFGVVDAKFYGDSSLAPIALLAHMDTSGACSGKDVKPSHLPQGEKSFFHIG